MRYKFGPGIPLGKAYRWEGHTVGKIGRLCLKRLRMLKTSRQERMLSLQWQQWTRPNDLKTLVIPRERQITTRVMSKQSKVKWKFCWETAIENCD